MVMPMMMMVLLMLMLLLVMVMVIQSAQISMSTLSTQGYPCVLCLATPASYISVAMWSSEWYCVR
eukprot:104817-Pyramimonas_sp.AAC.1